MNMPEDFVLPPKRSRSKTLFRQELEALPVGRVMLWGERKMTMNADDHRRHAFQIAREQGFRITTRSHPGKGLYIKKLEVV